MATSISTLKAMLVLDTSQWNQGFLAAQKSAQGFVSAVGGKATAAIAAITGGLAGAVTGAIAAKVNFHDLMESLSNVATLSVTAKKLGITVESTQKLGMAAAQTGVDLDTLSNGLLLMGKNIGSGGKSLDKRFLDVADAFTKIGDAGERASFARKVFGRGGFEFINLLAKGSGGIARSADAIDRFSLAIKDADAAKAKEALVAMKEFKEVVGALKDKLVVELAPSMTRFFEEQLNSIEKIMGAWKSLSGVIGGIKPPNVPFKEFFASVGESMEAMNKKASPFLNLIFPGLGNLTGMPGKGISFLGKRSSGVGGEWEAAAKGGSSTAASALAGLATKQHPKALQFGTVEAMSAITQAGGQQPVERLVGIATKILTLKERDAAAKNRAETKSPLRASNLRGGGSR